MEEKTEVVVERTESDTKRKGGERGTVGKPTAALTLKQRWHASGSGLPLKQWARLQMKTGDNTAKTWFDHKAGSLNAKRSEANVKSAREARVATRATRRKKKSEGSTK